jgi:O-antigen/teichoic acid export membrane protein
VATSRPAEERVASIPARQPTLQTVAQAMSWVAVSHLVSQAAWFGSLLVIAALVAPSSFGAFTAGIVVVAVAMLLMEAGTSGSLVARRVVTAVEVRKAVLLNFATGSALATALIALAEPIVATLARSGDAVVLRGLSLSIVFMSLAVVPLALLQRELLFKSRTVAITCATLLASALAVALAVLGAGVWALVARQVIYAVMVALGAWWAARHVVPRGTGVEEAAEESVRRGDSAAFLGLAAASFVFLNLDFIIVGARTDAHQLGLYALAFTIAFAPLTNFSWKLGSVLFPAVAATLDGPKVARRTLRAVRLISLVLLPLLAPVVLLAPAVIPEVLGERWSSMIVPLQILAVAGTGHAVLNVIGESLSGTGNIRLHALLQAALCLVIAPVMLVCVDIDGIRGAALAHVLVLIIAIAGYGVLGARRLGMTSIDVGRALSPVALAVAVQWLASVGTLVVADAAGAGKLPASLVASISGLGAAAAVLRFGSWNAYEEVARVLRATRGGVPQLTTRTSDERRH